MDTHGQDEEVGNSAGLQLILCARGTRMVVRKPLILQNLTYFQEDTTRPNASEYKLRIAVISDVLGNFVKSLGKK
jgi:hypothetical protein